MVQWIMVCVSGASYSISVNGNLHGYFKGKRGLRQGDPLSPYLFTLVMETLTLLLQRRIWNSEELQYHHLCNKQRIINLCFADGLFLFAHGHPSSVSVIMDALEEFKQVSGLVPSIPKSTAYFCNVPNAIKASILNSMPFAEGVLPVRYLGVPLISSRLLYRDCKILVEKLESRASVFILPSRIVHDLEQLMRGFLWCQGEMKKGKAKVAWDSVCMPKQEGGLGIRRIEDFNIALMATHIWSILTHGESLWPIDWLSRIPVLAHLHVPLLLDDLDDVILWRDSDGVLRPFLVACVWDTIRTRADLVNWYKVIWFPHCIPRHAIHIWLVVQQKLKTQDRLRQWDVGLNIDLNLLKCPLCDLVPDSHDHLFFECSFSSQVWSKVRVLCGMDDISPRLMDVVAFIIPISKGKTVVIILSRIMVAATSYYIWLERNGRLFKKNTSSLDQIVDVIMSTVRLKLVTFKFKKVSTKSRLLLDQWKIPSYCIVHDGSTRQSLLDHSYSYRVAAGLWDVRLIICSHLGSCLERIEKTKRSKNDQKPTRNEKKTKSQEQDKEISQKSQPDQPDTVKLSYGASKKIGKTKISKNQKLLRAGSSVAEDDLKRKADEEAAAKARAEEEDAIRKSSEKTTKKKIKEAKREARKKLAKKKQPEKDTEENVLDNEDNDVNVNENEDEADNEEDADKNKEDDDNEEDADNEDQADNEEDDDNNEEDDDNEEDSNNEDETDNEEDADNNEEDDDNKEDSDNEDETNNEEDVDQVLSNIKKLPFLNATKKSKKKEDDKDVLRLRHCMVESVVRQLCGLRLEKKSYADKTRKPLEFSVGDNVLFKVSPWKGVVRFGKKGKLAPREFKKLKRSRIAIVKVLCNLRRGPEFTWEREDQMKLKYPHLFSDVSS
ncbi:putative reverse transcriptase domain-containing protein [Tanacetum coccineum]